MEASRPIFHPFPGLRRFDTDEAHLFFGREGQSTELLRLLREHRFLAVLGSSGSGKSSLVRAGLLPSLYGGFMRAAGSDWRIAVMRPGTDPITKLAATLADPSVLGSAEVEPAMQTTLIEATLRRGGLGLVEAVTEARLPEGQNLLVVVDQFEEIFRFQAQSDDTEVRDDAAAFVKLLLEAGVASGTRIYVILTMRSDYLGDCSQFRDLPEAINRGKYLIPRMTREQRRLAIEGPVAVGGGTIAPRLVNRMLNDMGSDPDQLPILQHAAMQTWKCWADEGRTEEPLDLAHYEAIGGMDTALSLHADKAYAELPDAQSRDIAEKVFRRLTERGADNREIRRPTRFSDLVAVSGASDEAVAGVIEVFRRPGRSFLMPAAGTELTATSLIDISHESLIRGWDRLAAWVEEEGESAKVYKRLADTAALWKQDRAGLWRDPDLQFALDWWERDKPTAAWAAAYDPDYELAREFLDQSRDARDAAARARKRQIRVVIAALAIGFVGMSMLAVWALGSRRAAVSARAVAVERQQAADSLRVVAEENAARAFTMQGRADSAAIEARLFAEQVDQQNTQLIAQRSALAVARDSARGAAELAEFHGDRAEAAERLARVQDLGFRWNEAASTLDQLEVESRDEHPFETVGLRKTRAANFSNMELWREAIEEYSAALRANPNDIGALVNRSDAYLNIGMPDSARADLEYVLARNPNYFLAHANMALALGYLGDYEGARRHYRLAIESTAYQASPTSQSKVSPDLDRVMGVRALSLDGGEMRTALSYGLASTRAFGGATGFDGFTGDLGAADAEAQSQDALLSALNWAWLHRDYRTADYGAHAAEGALWARAGRATGGEVTAIFDAEATRSYCRFLAAHAEDGDVRYADLAVWVEAELSGPARCRRVELEPSVEATPDVATLIVLAQEHQARDDWQAADAVLTEALALEPNNPQIVLQRANVREALVDVYSSLPGQLRAGIERDSSRSVDLARRLRGLEESLRTTGSASSADAAARQDSIDLLRRSLAELQAKVTARRDSLGNLSAEDAEIWYDLALADADRALEIAPYFAEAYYVRGRVLYERATWDDLLDTSIVADIVKQFDLALRYDPTDGNAHMYRALALKRTDFPEASSSYRRALETFPQSAWMWQDLAEMEYAQDRYPEALRAIDVAIGILPERLSYYDDRAVIVAAMRRPSADVQTERAAGYRMAALEILQSGDTAAAHEALGGSAGILLLLAESEPATDISPALARTFNVGNELGLEPDVAFGFAASWLSEEELHPAAVAAYDSAIARNPYNLDYWQDRFSAEVDDDRDLPTAARKAGYGIIALGDHRVTVGELNTAVFAFWRASVYFAGAEVFGASQEGADTLVDVVDAQPSEDLRIAVEKMFDAERDYLGDEAEMIEFFRNFVAPGGDIEEQLGEGNLRERLRFVIGFLVEERASATG